MLFLRLGAPSAEVADLPAALGYRVARQYRDAEAFLAQLSLRAPAPARARPVRVEPDETGIATLIDGVVHTAAGQPVDRAGHEAAVSRLLAAGGASDPHRFDGSFVIARYEPAAGRLRVHSDAVGMRSLYYHEADGVLTAASTLRLLLAIRGIPDEPDLEAIALRMTTLSRLGAGRSPYAHIAMLTPGQTLDWRRGRSRAAAWWHPVPRTAIRHKSDKDYVEAARELLDRAVAKRLPPAGPVICHLSGGLDSGAVTSAAARLHGGAVHTLTMRPSPDVELPPEDAASVLDEWPAAQSVLAQYPDLVGHAAAAELPELAEEQPGGRFWSREWAPNTLHHAAWLLPATERLAAEIGAGTVLVGGMGNATLSYNGRRAVADQIARLHWLAAAANVAAQADGWRECARLAWRNGILPLVPTGMRQRFDRLRGLAPPFAEWSALRPELIARLALDRAVIEPIANTGSPDLDWHITMIEEYRQFNARSAAGRVHQRYDTADPLSDLDLIEFCLAIPRDQYLRRGVERFLARRVVAGRVPEAIVAQRRIGRANVEWFDWMNRRRDWIAAEFARIEQSPLACEVLDISRMRAVLANWPRDAAEANRSDRVHLMRHALGHGLRVGQFLVRLEGRNL